MWFWFTFRLLEKQKTFFKNVNVDIGRAQGRELDTETTLAAGIKARQVGNSHSRHGLWWHSCPGLCDYQSRYHTWTFDLQFFPQMLHWINSGDGLCQFNRFIHLYKCWHVEYLFAWFAKSLFQLFCRAVLSCFANAYFFKVGLNMASGYLSTCWPDFFLALCVHLHLNMLCPFSRHRYRSRLYMTSTNGWFKFHLCLRNMKSWNITMIYCNAATSLTKTCNLNVKVHCVFLTTVQAEKHWRWKLKDQSENSYNVSLYPAVNQR